MDVGNIEGWGGVKRGTEGHHLGCLNHLSQTPHERSIDSQQCLCIYSIRFIQQHPVVTIRRERERQEWKRERVSEREAVRDREKE